MPKMLPDQVQNSVPYNVTLWTLSGIAGGPQSIAGIVLVILGIEHWSG